WNAQTATSHKPVDDIMQSLITQPGEPILTFGSPAGGDVSVSQQRFFLDPELTPETSKLGIPSASPFDANARAKGYYRTRYPESIFKDLIAGAETRLTAP